LMKADAPQGRTRSDFRPYGRGRAAFGPARPLWLAGLLTCALNACAAEPPLKTKGADASSETADTAPFEFGVFESGVSVTCVSTTPRVTPVDPGLAGASCLFDVAPPVPGGEFVSNVLADGVSLPPSEYELHGYDLLELVGAACQVYRDGQIANVAVHVACPVY